MRSKTLVIFEGPDGGGKSTAIKSLCDIPDTYTTHHGPYQYVKNDLPRLYQESMMPAVLGHRTTFLDRSWLSELPYGIAYRNGADRIGRVNQRHLERLALRCDAHVVLCLPPWETVKANYLRRQHGEYLKTVDQLRVVYEEYTKLSTRTDLPVMIYDYTVQPRLSMVRTDYKSCHRLDMNSGGSLKAKVLLVGDTFGNKHDGDPLAVWPFSSFHSGGCSRWLTEQLMMCNISEKDLCWVNADELTTENVADIVMGKMVIALGLNADKQLDALHVGHEVIDHPQYHKRFHTHEPYTLIDLITTHYRLLRRNNG